MAVAIKPTDIHHQSTAEAARRTHVLPRTECLTPVAVTIGLVLWAAIILLVRAIV
ncbi:MAG: hypothetical protein ACHQSE_15120 [Gemmatimonadales bacterium]